MANRSVWILGLALAVMPGFVRAVQGPPGLVVTASFATITPELANNAFGPYSGYSSLQVSGGTAPYSWHFVGTEFPQPDSYLTGIPGLVDAVGNGLACGDAPGDSLANSLFPSMFRYCNFTPSSNGVGGKFSIRVTDSQGLVGTIDISVIVPLTISPANAGVATQGSLPLLASGGIGSGYAWAMVSNPSGGTINGQGKYSAGMKYGVTDTVRVTDAVGTTATLGVAVTRYPPIVVAPAAPSVMTRGTMKFTASGGTGKGYRWSVAATNAGDPQPVCYPSGCSGTSGGAIGSSSGGYVAGTAGGISLYGSVAKPVYDTVHVTDSAGNIGSAYVAVVAPVPPLTISPSSASTAAGQSVIFSAAGGYGGGYKWTLKLNPSGGQLDRGTYTAGPGSGVVDQIEVTDPAGAVATASIKVSRLPAFAVEPGAADVKAGDKLVFAARRATSQGTRVISQSVPVTWSLVPNGSSGSIDPQTGAYTAGAVVDGYSNATNNNIGFSTDRIQAVDASGNMNQALVRVHPTISLSPNPAIAYVNGSFTISVFDSALPDPTGKGWVFELLDNPSGAGITWVGSDCTSAGCLNTVPESRTVTAGSNAGVDTVRVTDWEGNTATLAVTVRSPVAISPAPSALVFKQALAFAATGGSRTGYAWSMQTNASGGSINATTGAYSAGTTAGTDVVQVTDSEGGLASVSIPVGPLVDPGIRGATPSTAAPLPCVPPVPPAKTGAPVALAQDITLRGTVPKGVTCGYSAAVRSGQTYVLSLTGIVGAAQLGVYNDVGFTKPVECLAPRNLGNSTYAQPADCSFVASGGTVYASVTGTSYLATASNRYNLRISPRNDAVPANQGTEQNPIVIQPDKPFAGTGGTGYSYYQVATAGTGDVVISMTGLIGTEDLGLNIYDNSKFAGSKLDNGDCHTSEFTTFAESCNLPAGRTYYLIIRSASPGGPFTLMVDSPAGTVAPPAAAPPAVAPNVIQQALPGSAAAP